MDFIRSHLNSLKHNYGQPTKQFLTESFREYPLITSTAAVFAMMSLAPLVSAVALALFSCILAVTVCFLTVVALALCLSVILSITLVLATVTTLLASGALWTGRSTRGAAAEETRAEETRTEGRRTPGPRITDDWVPQRASAALKRTVRLLASPIKSTGWKSRLLAFVLFRNIFARIFLPRAVRYHRFYPVVFGSKRSPHPLKWVILRALWPLISIVSTFAKITSVFITIALLPLRLISAVGLGWEAVLSACVLALLFSPRLRAAAGKGIVRGASFAGVRGETALTDFNILGRTVLTSLVDFLRATLEEWDKPAAEVRADEQPAAAEEPAAQATSTPAPKDSAPAADAVHDQEMAPSTLSADGASTTAVSTAGGSKSGGVRARIVSGAI
ncbi:hypothetical protein C8R44DRAFT_981597 [Mycena epipterygia]|nr:hypothetical protein C8R44DRAFT_981597 [Mycena epipterygia]